LIVAWHWRHLSAEQRAAALRDLAGCGPEGKGVPPSGEDSVLWVETPGGWRWKGGIFPVDVEQGIRIGVPAGAVAEMLGMPQTIYVVTPAAPPVSTVPLSRPTSPTPAKSIQPSADPAVRLSGKKGRR